MQLDLRISNLPASQHSAKHSHPHRLVVLSCLCLANIWIRDAFYASISQLRYKPPASAVTASVDGTINLVVRYGSKPLEFAKGKNAIELASGAEVADVLAEVREAAENGELDAVIEQQARFGRRLSLKNK